MDKPGLPIFRPFGAPEYMCIPARHCVPGYQYHVPTGLRDMNALLPGTACQAINISPLRGSRDYMHSCLTLRAWLPIFRPFGAPGYIGTPTRHYVPGLPIFRPYGAPGIICTPSRHYVPGLPIFRPYGASGIICTPSRHYVPGLPIFRPYGASGDIYLHTRCCVPGYQYLVPTGLRDMNALLPGTV